MVFVELPKFMAKNISEKKLQVLWLRYLTEIDDKTIEVDKTLMDNPEIRQAIETVEESAFTKAEIEAYDKYWDIIRTEKTLMSGAKEEGFVEGEKNGFYKTTILSLRKGLDFETISSITGLPKTTIEKLSALLIKYGNQAEKHFDELNGI